MNTSPEWTPPPVPVRPCRHCGQPTPINQWCRCAAAKREEEAWDRAADDMSELRRKQGPIPSGPSRWPWPPEPDVSLDPAALRSDWRTTLVTAAGALAVVVVLVAMAVIEGVMRVGR